MSCCSGRSSPRRLSTGTRWGDGQAEPPGLLPRSSSTSGCARTAEGSTATGVLLKHAETGPRGLERTMFREAAAGRDSWCHCAFAYRVAMFERSMHTPAQGLIPASGGRPAEIDRIMEDEENETTLLTWEKDPASGGDQTPASGEKWYINDSRLSAPAQRQPERAGDPSLWRVPTQRGMRRAWSSRPLGSRLDCMARTICASVAVSDAHQQIRKLAC